LGGWLNAVIAVALVAGGWWAIVDLLSQSLRRDDERTPIRRPILANRVRTQLPRPSGPLNRSGRPSVQMSDLSQ
jgi:hypothetical protein